VNLYVKQKYYSRVRRNEPPIKFYVNQPRGIRTDVYGTIYIDPILKKYPDLRIPMINHEMNEIRAWGRGLKSAHTKARSKEPRTLQRIGGVSGFWREIARREKAGRR